MEIRILNEYSIHTKLGYGTSTRRCAGSYTFMHSVGLEPWNGCSGILDAVPRAPGRERGKYERKWVYCGGIGFQAYAVGGRWIFFNMMNRPGYGEVSATEWVG